MMPLELIFSVSFIMLSLAIYAVMFALKTAGEFILKDKAKSKVWTDLVLPIAPVCIGAVVGHFAALGILAGLVAGLMSGLVYRVAKSFLIQKVSPEPTDQPTIK
jgi:hypothetical protein